MNRRGCPGWLGKGKLGKEGWKSEPLERSGTEEGGHNNRCNHNADDSTNTKTNTNNL